MERTRSRLVRFTRTLVIFWVVFFIISALAYLPQSPLSQVPSALAAPDGTGMYVYDEDGFNNVAPHYRTWSGSDLSAESNLQDDETASDDTNHTIIEAAPTRNEYLMGRLVEGGHLDVQVYTDGAWANGSNAPTNGDFTTGIGATNDIVRSFDIAYENDTGDGIVVYESSSSGDGHLKYRTWDGSAWSAELDIDYSAVDEGNDVAAWVECDADFGSDNILCAWRENTNLGIYGARWDGSAWQDISAINTLNGTNTRQDFDVAWEGTSGEGMVVYGAIAVVDASTYTVGSGFADTANIATISGAAQWIEIAGSPNNNYIAAIINNVSSTTSADIDVDMWNGSDWTTISTPATMDDDINSNGFAQAGDVAWEQGGGDRALFVWRDGTTNETLLRYMFYDISANQWQAIEDGTQCANTEGGAGSVEVITSLAAAEDAAGPCTAVFALADTFSGVDLNPDPASNKIMVLAEDLTADLMPELFLYNGDANATWTQTATMAAPELDLSTGATLSATFPTKTYDFAYRGSNASNVAVLGAQTSSVNTNTSNDYIGGAFAISSSSSVNVTSITISEQGTVNASTNLDNIKLLYEADTTSPYNCASVAYGGAESQYGSTDTDGFSAANGDSTFTGSVAITSTSTMCVYVVLDVGAAANNETIEIQITNPSTGVVVSAGGIGPTYVRAISGTTTLVGAVTTLGNGTDPGNSTVAPGSGITDIDQFSFTTSTSTDTITALTVTLSPASSYDNISQVDITDTSNLARCTAVSNPASLTVSFDTCSSNGGVTASTGGDTYKIRVTPKTHANMPAVPGASYAITATVTNWTGTNTHAGTDSASATITIDNASPNSATSTSGTAGDTAVTLNWTTASGETTDSIVLRWAASSPGAEVPVEGTSYSAGNTITTATVACVITAQTTATALSKVDGTSGSSGCNTSALSNGTAYSYKVFQKDSNGNYDAGLTFTGSPFTPVTSVTISGTSNGTGTVKVAINGVLDATHTGTISAGNWSISSVTITSGQIAVVWIDGTADDTTESTAVFKYDGTGDMTGIVLNANVLSIGSIDNQSLTAANLGLYDCDDDEDIMHSSNSGTLLVEGCTNSYSNETLQIESGDTLALSGSETVTTSSLTITGTLTAATTGTITITGSGTPLSVSGTFTPDTSTLLYSGTSATNITATTYNNLSFTPSSGTPTYTLPASDITLRGNLLVSTGTVVTKSASNKIIFARTGAGTSTITGNATNSDLGIIQITNGGGVTTLSTSSNIKATSITVDASQNLDISSDTVTLTGTSTPLTLSGSNTFTVTGSTIDYTGNGATGILATTYNNLGLKPSSSSDQVLTAGTYTVGGTLTVGDGTNAGATAATNNPMLTVTGTTTVAAGATFTTGTGVVTLTGDVTVTGTISGSGSGTISAAGSVTGAGTINISGNTFEQRVASSKNFGPTGSNSWTFATLTFGRSAGTPTITTQTSGTGDITVTSVLNIGKSGDGSATILDAGDIIWTLSASGTPLVFNASSTLTVNTSTFNYTYVTGSGSITVTGATYYNLGVGTTSDGNAASTFTLGANTTVNNLLTIGNTGSTNNDVLNTSAASSFSLTTASLILTSKGTLTANGSTITITGSGTPLTGTGVFNPGTSTAIYNSTSATNITATTYNNLSLTPAGTPIYTLGTAGSQTITVNNDLTIGNGTNGLQVNHTAWDPVVVVGGNLLFEANIGAYAKGNSGVLPAFRLSPTGTKTWTDNNATKIDIGIVAINTGSSTPKINLGSSVTVTGLLISASHTLDLNGSNTLTITGSGTGAANRPLQNSGTFIASTGTVAYTGTSTTDISSVTLDGITFNNLSLLPAGTVTYNFGSAASQTVTVSGNLIVGNGTNALTVTDAAYNPVLNVTGTTTIANAAIFTTGTGTWTQTGNLTVTGTLSGTADGTISAAGDVTGAGTVNLTTAGTFEQRVASSKNFGPTGSNSWTFVNLTFGRSAGTPTITTQTSGTGNVTVTGTLNIGKSGDAGATILDAGDIIWTASANDAPVVFNASSTLTANTSTFNYTYVTGGGSITIANATYNNLGIGTTSDANAASTFTLLNNTTVSGTLTIGNGSSTNADILNTSAASSYSLTAANISITAKGTLTANSSAINITGSGDPLTITAGGTFNTGTSTVSFNAPASTNIPALTYNNLQLVPQSSAPTYTLGAGTFVINDFVTGDGSHSNSVTAATNNPAINLIGNLTVGALNTYTKGSGVLTFMKGGSQTWTDNNSTKQDIGAVVISANGTDTTVSTSTSVKATSITVDASQNLDISSDTVTLTGTSTPLTLSGSNTFTVTGSTIDYTGNGATGILATTYNNLGLKPSSSSDQVLTAGTYTVGGTLTVGDGSNAGATAATNNPMLTVTGTTTVANAATLTQGTGAFTFNGDLNLTSSATYVDGSGNMIFSKGGGGTQTLTDSTGGQNLGNVQISAHSGNTTLLLGSNATMTAVTIDASQTLNPDTNILTLTGTSPITNNGSLTASAGTVAFVPTQASGTVTIPAMTFYNAKFNKSSNTFTIGSGTFTTNNNLEITAGTLDLNTNDPVLTVKDVLITGTLSAASLTANPLTVTGNFTNNGTFTHNSGKVIVTPVSISTFAGSTSTTTFQDFYSAAVNKTIQFKAGNVYAFSGTLSLNGVAGGGRISILSDTVGVQWLARVTSEYDLHFLRLRDAGCSSSNEIKPPSSIIDMGNNDTACWKFIRKDAGNGASEGGSGGSGAIGGGGSGGGSGSSGGGAGGSFTLPETFTDTNGVALATHNSSWATVVGNFAINTNAVYSNSADADTLARWGAGSFNANQFAEITIKAVTSGAGIGVAVRINGNNAYSAYTDSQASKIYEWTNGSANLLYTGAAYTVNDVLRLEVTGTSITLKKNGTTLTTVTDSSISTGSPGLSGFSNNSLTRGDDWTAGSFSDTGGGGGGASP